MHIVEGNEVPPEYAELRDNAVRLYLEERQRRRKFIVIGVALFLILFFNFGFTFFPRRLLRFVILWWIADCFCKLHEAKANYRYRLYRAVETLTELGIFMDIPPEDLHRFDGVFQ